ALQKATQPKRCPATALQKATQPKRCPATALQKATQPKRCPATALQKATQPKRCPATALQKAYSSPLPFSFSASFFFIWSSKACRVAAWDGSSCSALASQRSASVS